MEGKSYSVKRLCSGSEDGFLWYVVKPDGSKLDGGWLHKEDAEMEAEYFNTPPVVSEAKAGFAHPDSGSGCDNCGRELVNPRANRCVDCANELTERSN